MFWRILLLTPTSEASGGYTKSLQGLDTFWGKIIILWSKAINFPDAPDQKWGVQNDWLIRATKWRQTKIIFFSFLCTDFCRTSREIFRIFEFFKFDHFRRRFTTLKQSLQKKNHIPRRFPRKDEDFEHLTFLIFKLLHNFLNDRWGDFQFS